MYVVAQLLEEKVPRFAIPIIIGSDNGPGLRANPTIPYYIKDIMLIEFTLVLLLLSMLIRIRYEELNTLIKWIKFKIHDACTSGHPQAKIVLLPWMGHRLHWNNCMMGVVCYRIRAQGNKACQNLLLLFPTAQAGPLNPSLPTEVSYSSSLKTFFCLMGDFGASTHTVSISNEGRADDMDSGFIPQAEI